MKYKVGDKVKIREDLVVDMGRDGVRVTKSMLKYAGKIARIEKTWGPEVYGIDVDNKEYLWTEEMFEDVDEMGNVKIKIAVDGNKVTAKMGKETGIAKCSPDDEFDIFVGAKLALERLEEKCNPYAWLKKGAIYYYPHVSKTGSVYSFCEYDNDEFDKTMISRGFVFKTEEEAIEAAKKMLAVLKEG